MEGFLDINNILTEDEASNIFLEDADETQPSQAEIETSSEEEEENDDNDILGTAEVSSEDLFDEEPEKVGSEEQNKKGSKESTSSSKEDGSSPNNTNFYSSIADALREDGAFSNLNDDDFASIEDAEDFRTLIDKLVNSLLEGVLKRIYEALNNGVEPSAIKTYENTLNYLNSITEDILTDEGEEGTQIRRRLLQQDFMNRGYKLERAVKMTEKLFATGEDIEEARLALEGNKEYFNEKYQNLLNEAKVKTENEKKEVKKRAEELKKNILNNDKIFGDIAIDKNTRQLAYDNITKPIYKDSETGLYYTALLKYRNENENDYLKNVGLLFTLTDGFTNMEKLIKPSAKKEVKKKLRELEHTLNNTARNGNGTLKFVGNAGNLSFFDSGFTIDIK